MSCMNNCGGGEWLRGNDIRRFTTTPFSVLGFLVIAALSNFYSLCSIEERSVK